MSIGVGGKAEQMNKLKGGLDLIFVEMMNSKGVVFWSNVKSFNLGPYFKVLFWGLIFGIY